MLAFGVTAAECAAAWSGIRRQEGIIKSQNQLQTQYARDGLRQMQLNVVMVARVCGRVPVYPIQ